MEVFANVMLTCKFRKNLDLKQKPTVQYYTGRGKTGPEWSRAHPIWINTIIYIIRCTVLF